MRFPTARDALPLQPLSHQFAGQGKDLHSAKLACNLKGAPLKRTVVFREPLVRFHAWHPGSRSSIEVLQELFRRNMQCSQNYGHLVFGSPNRGRRLPHLCVPTLESRAQAMGHWQVWMSRRWSRPDSDVVQTSLRTCKRLLQGFERREAKISVPSTSAESTRDGTVSRTLMLVSWHLYLILLQLS